VGRRPTSSSHGRLFVLLRGDGGISLKEDFPAAPTSGAVTNALERVALSGLDTEAEAPRSTINSLGPRGQTPALSSESTEPPKASPPRQEPLMGAPLR
jgi:hypothetical protein